MNRPNNSNFKWILLFIIVLLLFLYFLNKDQPDNNTQYQKTEQEQNNNQIQNTEQEENRPETGELPFNK